MVLIITSTETVRLTRDGRSEHVPLKALYEPCVYLHARRELPEAIQALTSHLTSFEH